MGSDADWQYQTVPQPGLGGRTIREPQGKGLGGSSAINGQAFIAPAQADIDAWERLGNDGWNWDGLVPYYKKSYTLIPPEDPATLEHLGIDWIDDQYRGTSGPIKVSFPGVLHNPLCKAWIDAFRDLNKITNGGMSYKISLTTLTKLIKSMTDKTSMPDPFSGKQIGGYSNAATVDPDTKTRSYAGTAYGAPAAQRPNVQILTNAKSQKILFENAESGKVKAIGVQALVNDNVQTFMAKKEVILAAGVYNTPKLLELSGIGNSTLLRQKGVPLVLDLPGVGENLQDVSAQRHVPTLHPISTYPFWLYHTNKNKASHDRR